VNRKKKIGILFMEQDERNRKVLKNDKKFEIRVQDTKCNKQKE
jgi:hypothetical protein